tara:strand:- start:237 stop:440 length:204 start_codon:yes stop_codon:yes gene_type:complete
MNIVKTEDKSNKSNKSKLRNNVHFLMFLNQVGYDNKTIDIIFSHEKLLKNIVETYEKIYNISNVQNS